MILFHIGLQNSTVMKTTTFQYIQDLLAMIFRYYNTRLERYKFTSDHKGDHKTQKARNKTQLPLHKYGIHYHYLERENLKG